MDISDIASGVIIITAVSAGAMYWLDLKLRPIKKRLEILETKMMSISDAHTIIVDGLLEDDQIPEKS